MPSKSEILEIKKRLKDPEGRMPAIFDALGDHNRCKLFKALLKRQDLNVSDMAKILEISVPAVSQHLTIMNQAKVLAKRKQGKNVFYSINEKDPTILLIAAIISSKGNK